MISQVTNEDCMEMMARYPDKYFELSVVDPPYGIGQDGAKNKTRGKLATATDYKPFYGQDKQPPDEAYFTELFRVSKSQVIWGANHFIERINRNSSCWLVWDKENGLNDFADCELAWTSFTTAVRKFSFTWNGMIQGDMKNKERRIHPTQKPVALYKWLLQNYAKSGDKILDTHLGSGSSRIAAYELGFDFYGTELDKDYFDAQEKRFADYKAQGNLFFEK
jgi:site-specific DNA-methyltransferase (adenine-specific)